MNKFDIVSIEYWVLYLGLYGKVFLIFLNVSVREFMVLFVIMW